MKNDETEDFSTCGPDEEESEEIDYSPYIPDDIDLTMPPEIIDALEDERDDLEIVARHPTLPHAIVQSHDDTLHAVAWIIDIKSNAIIWHPKGAIKMAWLRDGAEIGVIFKKYTPDPQHPAIIGSPLQSEFAYTFQRFTWPDLHHINSCPITMRTGWPTTLLSTPDPNFVMFEWYDQGEAGYEGIVLDDQHGDAQDKRESYEIGMPMLGPALPVVFSSDARYMVRCQSIYLPETMLDVWEHTLIIAYLTIIDRRTPSIRDIPITTTLKPGWSLPASYRQKPADARKNRNGWVESIWIQSCAFHDENQIVLRSFDGTTQRIDLRDSGLEPLRPMPDYLPISQQESQLDRETLQQLYRENSAQLFPCVQPIQHPYDSARIVTADRYAKKQKQWIAGSDGQIIWDPDDVLKMIWLKNGHEIAAIRGTHYRYGEQRDQQIVFERLSWPELRLLSRLSLPGWSGEPFAMTELLPDKDIIIAWHGKLAEFPYYTTMVYRLRTGNQEDHILDTVHASLYGISEYVQNESGTLLLTYHPVGILWPTHAEMLRWRRRMIVGWATLFDWQARCVRQILFCEDFPANWQPPDLDQRHSPLLPWYMHTRIPFIEQMAFLDDTTLQISFTTKRTGVISLFPNGEMSHIDAL